MKKQHLLGVMIFLGALLGGFLNTGEANATLVATDDQLYKLSLLSGLEECYEAGIKSSIQKSNFSGLGSVITNSNKKVYITTHIGNTLSGNSDNDLKCSEVINGWHADRSTNSAKGINQLFGTATTPEDAGYKLQTTTTTSGDATATKKLSFNNFLGDTSRAVATFSGELEFENPDDQFNSSCTGEILIKYNNTEMGQLLCSGSIVTITQYTGDPHSLEHTSYYMLDLSTSSFDYVRGKIEEQAQAIIAGYNFGTEYEPNWIFSSDDYTKITATVTKSSSDSGESSFSEYVPTSSNLASNAQIAINRLGVDGSLPGCAIGSSFISFDNNYDYTSCRFGQATTYALYYRYVEKNDGLQIQECGASSSATYKIKNSSDEWCAVAVKDSSALSDSYSIVNSNGRLTSGTMTDVLTWLSNEDNYSLMSDDKYADETITADIVTDEDGNPIASSDSNPDCWDADLDSMSWIACPTLSNLQNTASGLDGMVEEWLTADSNMFGSDSSTHEVWEVMRNIANFTMIIIILVIVISQITGTGIDNYGIKKMLPRLIVMAILINLSFIVCQLAIELSNIFGSGLSGMFKSIGLKLAESNGFGANFEAAIGTIITAILGAVGIAGAAAGTVITGITIATSGAGAGMIIIMLIILLIPVIIAILLFFLALGLRMIIIIACTALSPLAFACYILPNTQKIFKKWWDLFKTALLIFPICGLLSGLSYLLKVMILSLPGVHLWMLIVCLVAPYAIFFLLPSLLKGAIAGLGAIGGAVTALGGAFKGGIGKGADAYRQNSESYKNATEMGQRNFRSKQAQSLVNRLNAKEAELKKKDPNATLGRSDMMQRARMQAILNRQTSEDAEVAAGISPVNFEAAKARALSKRSAEDLESEISLMKDATRFYDADTMNAQLTKLLTSSSAMSDSDRIRAKALMKKMSTGSGYGQKLLAQTLGGANGAHRQFVAEFMSKDSDVVSAVSRKDNYTAQYLRDVNVGKAMQDANGVEFSASDLTYEQWAGMHRVNIKANGTKEVNAKTNTTFVAEDVITDDRDFLSQSAKTVENHIGDIDDTRLTRMIENERLMQSIDGDVYKHVMAAAQSKGITPSWQKAAPPANSTQG